MDRLLVPIPEPAPERLRVEGDAFHHLVRVLRASVGTRVELFDGAGRTCPAWVEQLHESSAELRIGAALVQPSGQSITVLQSLPKGDRWDFVLQKGTELGATAFAPVISARGVVRLSDARAAERLLRWQRVAAEAARQCGRADVPDLLPLRTLAEALRALPRASRLWVLDEEERSLNLRQLLNGPLDPSPLTLAVGPEGGWTREEVALCRDHGAQAVSLGPRILRTETAALAVLAVLSFIALPAGE